MERLVFDLESGAAPGARRPPVVVGVVASGNLEVLVEPGEVAAAATSRSPPRPTASARSGRRCCRTSPRGARSPGSRSR